MLGNRLGEDALGTRPHRQLAAGVVGEHLAEPLDAGHGQLHPLDRRMLREHARERLTVEGEPHDAARLGAERPHGAAAGDDGGLERGVRGGQHGDGSRCRAGTAEGNRRQGVPVLAGES